MKLVKIKNNKDIPIFTMMVGLPGSGKSTYAKELAFTNCAVVYSSDVIRKELFGDEKDQDNNEEVFKVLHSRIKDSLKKGNNVIYDATNINSKRRRAFLKELRNINCKKNCVIMATPYMRCVIQNTKRDRIVPYKVIETMYKSWNTPYRFEGWDQIILKFSDCCIFNTKENWISRTMKYNQDNPHHELTLGQHCKKVGDLLLGENLSLCYAGCLHDLGKPFTKSFVNSKGEETDVAHYYQHHCVGLMIVYFSHIQMV